MYSITALVISLLATQGESMSVSLRDGDSMNDLLAHASTLTPRTITALQARQSLDPTDGNWGQVSDDEV